MTGLTAHFRYCIAACACLFACALPAIALADTPSSGGTSQPSQPSSDPYTTSGGTSPDDPQYQPHGNAILLPNGQAIAPSDAPPEVAAVIAAGNKIATLPYVYGGGHNAKFSGRGYDCSGSVSYALHGGGLLTAPLDSSSFMNWGQSGPGSWITIYTNPGHAFMVVAGLRFDTSMRTPIAVTARKASTRTRRAFTVLTSRWSSKMRPSSGYTIRHPLGF
jgi:hypothetical protein